MDEERIYAPQVIFDDILKHPPFHIADDNVDMRKKAIEFLKFIYQDFYPMEIRGSLAQEYENGKIRMFIDSSKDSIVGLTARLFSGWSKQLEALDKVFDYASLVQQCYEMGLSKYYNLKPCIVNIYAMLSAINKNKRGFDKIVQELSFIPFSSGRDNFDFAERDKLMIDAILECEYPHKVDLLKQLINKSNVEPFPYDYNKLAKGLKLLDTVTKDAVKVNCLANLETISADVLEYCKASTSDMAPIYYNAALISPGYYESFRKKVLANVKREDFRRDILDLVGEVEWYFLKRRGYSFDRCLDAVFDSDTLGELINKLNVLKSYRHDYSFDEKMKSQLDGIFTGQCVDKIGNTEISSSIFTDKIEKPKFIEDRTKLLYCKVFDIDENDFDRWMFYLKLRNISEVVEKLHENVTSSQEERAKQLKKTKDSSSPIYDKWSAMD